MEKKIEEKLNEISNKLYKTDYKYIGLDACKVLILEQSLTTLSLPTDEEIERLLDEPKPHESDEKYITSWHKFNKSLFEQDLREWELNQSYIKGYQNGLRTNFSSEKCEGEKWISIEERLPEDGVPVLAFQKKQVTSIYNYSLCV